MTNKPVRPPKREGAVKTDSAPRKALPPEARRAVFLNAYEELSDVYSPVQLGLLCGLGHSQTRSDLDRKLRDPSLPSARGVSQSDALLWQMLLLLHRDGYDLASFKFDDAGYLSDVARRPQR